MKLGITVNNERFAVFDPTTGELLSLPNKKPTEGSFIPVADSEVKGILEGRESMHFYYVHYIKRANTYELRQRSNHDIDSYFVDDLIYELPTTGDNPDITVTKNIKDTCWKIEIGGDLEMNILAQKVSLTNGHLSFSVTKKDDPNILYKTLQFTFDKLINGNYIVLPFSEKFEFDNEPISVYTIKKFDSYKYEVINEV